MAVTFPSGASAESNSFLHSRKFLQKFPDKYFQAVTGTSSDSYTFHADATSDAWYIPLTQLHFPANVTWAVQSALKYHL